ncbi:MAG: hypothetical protein WCK53_00170 [Methanomicrobiales archaeon]
MGYYLRGTGSTAEEKKHALENSDPFYPPADTSQELATSGKRIGVMQGNKEALQ